MGNAHIHLEAVLHTHSPWEGVRRQVRTNRRMLLGEPTDLSLHEAQGQDSSADQKELRMVINSTGLV